MLNFLLSLNSTKNVLKYSKKTFKKSQYSNKIVIGVKKKKTINIKDIIPSDIFKKNDDKKIRIRLIHYDKIKLRKKIFAK